MAWYENYDLMDDPFFREDIAYGMDGVIEELIYRAESGSMAYVEGKHGAGKSAVMRELIDRFRGEGRLIYFDCGTVDRKVNIEGLMKGKYGLAGKVFGVIPKNMILLLDNANELSKKNCERIKYYFDNNFIKSVVFTGESYAKAHFSKSVRDRIGGRVIKLKELAPEQVFALVKQRAPELDLFTDDMVKKVFKKSKRDMKKFLTSMSQLCDMAIEEGTEKVSEEQLARVFGEAQ